jgi:hypothetical protein
MRSDWPAVDDVSGDAFLIGTDGCDDAEGSRVDLRTAVADDADDDFLPALLAPGFASVAFAQISNVLHDTVHGPCKEAVVLIIHGHDDEQLRSTGRVIVDLTERESIVLEVVRVASSGGISHVGVFTLILVYAEVKQLCRDSRIKHKVAMEEPV